MTSEQFTPFLEACNALASRIKQQEANLLALLTNYETHETAHDEVTRSLDALQGLPRELSAIAQPRHDLTIATIFPLNLPLYSLVIFGIAPSAFASNVFIRPPEVMHEVLSQLWELLGISELFPVVSLKVLPRHIFTHLYAAEADVIVFTGKYENALAIHEDCPAALLVYNGSGVNPVLVFDNADIDLAVKKSVEMRLFNSGQDCAGPDAFFVPSRLVDTFVSKLQVELEKIKVGDSKDPTVRVSRTLKEAYIDELKNWLAKQQRYVVYGGEIDDKNHLVHPTIVRKKLEEQIGDSFHEFFAPFFYVLEYDDLDTLQLVLESPAFTERAMYTSVFGSNAVIEKVLSKSVQVLDNVIVNDVERGNSPYGGFGPHANFLLYGDKKVVHPILISRDMNAMLDH